MTEGIRAVTEGLDKATDEARWFKLIAPGGYEALGMAVFGYRGHELTITTMATSPIGMVFKGGDFRFDFAPTLEGIAEDRQKIDAIIDGTTA